MPLIYKQTLRCMALAFEKKEIIGEKTWPDDQKQQPKKKWRMQVSGKNKRKAFEKASQKSCSTRRKGPLTSIFQIGEMKQETGKQRKHELCPQDQLDGELNGIWELIIWWVLLEWPDK